MSFIHWHSILRYTCLGRRKSGFDLRVLLQRINEKVFRPKCTAKTAHYASSRHSQVLRCGRDGVDFTYHDRARESSSTCTIEMFKPQCSGKRGLVALGLTPYFGPLHDPLTLHLYNLVVQVALAFLNDTCSSTHGRVCVSSIFITPSGEWKLGGFELLSTPKDDAPVLYVRLIVVWRRKTQIILPDEGRPLPVGLYIRVT